MQEVQSRMVTLLEETESPSLFTDVMFELDSIPETLEKFEKKALSMLDLLQPNELYRLFYFLARNKRAQSFHLISTIKTKLMSRPIHFDKTKLRNLFFACSVLKVYDERLLTAMSENLLDTLLNDVFQDQQSIALPVLMSCVKLGWNHENLTSLLMKMVETVSTELRPTDRLALLNGIGRLKLKESEKLVKVLMADMTKMKDSNPDLHLQIVKAFTIMRQADAKTVQGVLEKQFYKPLIDSLKGKNKAF